MKHTAFLLIAFLFSISAAAKTVATDTTSVSNDELEYWLSEFGQEVLDTLDNSPLEKMDEDIVKEEDQLTYYLKEFGKEVLDTLNRTEGEEIVDTMKLIDDKLSYFMKDFGKDVVDTLITKDSRKEYTDSLMQQERLAYYLKEFGKNVVDTLNQSKNNEKLDSMKLLDDKLNYFMKDFGREVLDTLDKKNNNKTIDKTQHNENTIDYLIKDFGQNVLDTLNGNATHNNATHNKDKEDDENLAKEILKSFEKDTVGGIVGRIERKVDVLMKEAEQEQLNKMPTTAEILSVVDSILLGINNHKVNPLFLDWVIGTPAAVSLSLNDEDSILVNIRTNVKDYIRATAPELYSYHKSQMPDISDLKGSQLHGGANENLRLNLDSVNIKRDSKLDVGSPNLPKWTMGAKFQVHASQNYISPNWYKGGESNIAVNSYVLGYFNYDNKSGLQWDSKVEWKLGVNSSGSDSLRWLRVNEDVFRINSKVGFKAFKSFYYTAEVDFQTQFFNTYKANSNIRTSGPFSPIRTNFSLGMDYKYKDMISLFISPLSYKLVYVSDTTCKKGVLPSENIPNQIGIKDGDRKSHQLGALVRFDFNHDFNESIGMEIKFNFFGNYVGKIKGVEVGCEVIGNFKINRFLTAKAVLYPRYDSTVLPSNGGKPKLQFWEMISLGFTYKI